MKKAFSPLVFSFVLFVVFMAFKLLSEYLNEYDDAYHTSRAFAIVFIFIFSAISVELMDDFNKNKRRIQASAYRMAVGSLAGASIAAILSSPFEAYALYVLIGGGLAYFGCSRAD